MNTYRNRAEAALDHAEQSRLLAALGARDNALRKDECGAWTIFGKDGHIYTWGKGGGWLIFTGGRSARHWTGIKSVLQSFCRVTQDGDEEGCFKLDRLPTSDEAEHIRHILRIPKRREVGEEELARLKRYAFRTALSVQDGDEAVLATATHPDPEEGK